MPVERRGWVIAFEIGSTGNGRNPIFNGRRQPSCGGTSRMTRECQVRICERLGVKFPGPHLDPLQISGGTPEERYMQFGKTTVLQRPGHPMSGATLTEAWLFRCRVLPDTAS